MKMHMKRRDASAVGSLEDQPILYFKSVNSGLPCKVNITPSKKQHFPFQTFSVWWLGLPIIPIFPCWLWYIWRFGIPYGNLKGNRSCLLTWNRPVLVLLELASKSFQFFARKRIPCIKLTWRGHQKWKMKRRMKTRCRSDSDMTAARGFCFL